MHIKLTLMILFLNIALTIFAPGITLGDNNIFTTNNEEQYVLNEDLQDSFNVADPEGGLPVGDFGITDVISFIYDFIQVLIAILFGSLMLIQYLYIIGSEFALIIGIPIVLSYGLAIMGWLR